MTEQRIACSAGTGRVCEGELLVSRMGFNARYDLDLTSGVFSRSEHDLFGRELAGKVFVFDGPKGGIATSWALGSLAQRGLAPVALVTREVNPVIVQGAVLAGIPLVAGVSLSDMARLRDGMRVRVDPHARALVLLS